MTTAQKIIKYCAVAFAIFLIITIISAVLSAGYRLLNAIGIIDSNRYSLLENMVTISDDAEEFLSLNLDIKSSNLQIKTGDKFEVKTNNSNIKYSNENGSIKIREDKLTNWFFGKIDIGELIIYIPENMKQIDEVKINIDAGTVFIEQLNTKNLYLDLGAGNVAIDKLTVSEESKINGGAGNININSGEIANVDLDLGVGNTKIKSDITGNSNINTGVGELNLYLSLDADNYKINVNKGLGKITFNNDKILDDTIIGNGENYIKISGGVGNINIETK